MMKEIKNLKELFYTKLKEPLKKLQPIADVSKSISKKLSKIYLLSFILMNIIIVYFVSNDWNEVLFLSILVLVFIPVSRYLHRYITYFYILMSFAYMMENDYFLAIFASAILIVFHTVHINSVKRRYRTSYTSWIIEPLFKELNASWKYDKYKHVYKKYFKDSWVFSTKSFIMSGTDRLKGKYLDVEFQISNVYASTKTRNEKGEDERGYTAHDGIVFACEFNKSLKYRTVILPDKAEKKYGSLIGRWLQSKSKNKMKLINMDYPEFEKEFKIYGQDEIETRYVLNHNIMNNILKLKQKLGDENLTFAFYLKHFVIFSDLSYNFNAPDSKYLQDFEHVEYDFETLSAFVSSIDALKLNEKLWS